MPDENLDCTSDSSGQNEPVGSGSEPGAVAGNTTDTLLVRIGIDSNGTMWGVQANGITQKIDLDHSKIEVVDIGATDEKQVILN